MKKRAAARAHLSHIRSNRRSVGINNSNNDNNNNNSNNNDGPTAAGTSNTFLPVGPYFVPIENYPDLLGKGFVPKFTFNPSSFRDLPDLTLRDLNFL